MAQHVSFLRDRPVYIWYEWGTGHKQFTGARLVYMADAVAWCSNEPHSDRRGTATRAAQLCCEIYVALDDKPNEWKQKGKQLADETLDNLVMLFVMQHNLQFETQSRLNRFPTF